MWQVEQTPVNERLKILNVKARRAMVAHDIQCSLLSRKLSHISRGSCQQEKKERLDGFLADRTNGHAYATVLRLSSVRNVLWLNGAS